MLKRCEQVLELKQQQDVKPRRKKAKKCLTALQCWSPADSKAPPQMLSEQEGLNRLQGGQELPWGEMAIAQVQ